MIALPLLAWTQNDPFGFLIGSKRRGLAPPPHRISLQFFGEFGRWYTDRIGFRGVLVRAGADLNYKILGRSINPRLVFGSDGWIFWNDTDEKNMPPFADMQGRLRFSTTVKREIDARVRAMHAALAACGIEFIVAVAPNKQSIYGEYLNLGRSYAKSATRLDDLFASLSPEARRIILDHREVLKAAKAQSRYPLFYKTDTHWNELGSFYSYQQIYDALRTKVVLPNAEKVELSNYVVIEEKFSLGDLPTNVLLLPGGLRETAPRLKSRTPMLAAKIENPGRELIYRGPERAPRLLMVRDSFGIGLIPYLAEHFSESVYIERREVRAEYIQKYRPDVVILSMVERSLPGLPQKLPPINLPCNANAKTKTKPGG